MTRKEEEFPRYYFRLSNFDGVLSRPKGKSTLSKFFQNKISVPITKTKLSPCNTNLGRNKT